MYNVKNGTKGGIPLEIELTSTLRGQRRQQWLELLHRCSLSPDENIQATVLIWDGDTLAASASRQANLLKCIAVDDQYQGEGLTATLLTQLRQDAFREGHKHLFLYTKPRNSLQFSSLFFYPVAKTKDVLLMENQPGGIAKFVASLPKAETDGIVGAAVMNCNPFTRGHRYLVETAAKECAHVYLFVLSEDKSEFSAADRLEMVRRGTADLPNVTVLPTGPYLISSATFPTYFLKERDRAEDIHCQLDVEIFLNHFVPRFGIRRRYVGTEPLSPMTSRYNEILKELLPARGVEVWEMPRLEEKAAPISASAVRAALAEDNRAVLTALLPDSTLSYMEEHGLWK